MKKLSESCVSYGVKNFKHLEKPTKRVSSEFQALDEDRSVYICIYEYSLGAEIQDYSKWSSGI